MSDKQNQINLKAFQDMLAAMPVGGGLKAKLDEGFTVSTITPESGKWYYAATCEGCGERAPIVPDPTDGKLGAVFVGPGAIRAKCGTCGAWLVARAPDLKPLRWK